MSRPVVRWRLVMLVVLFVVFVAYVHAVYDAWGYSFGPESWLLLVSLRGLSLTLWLLALGRSLRRCRWLPAGAAMLFIFYFIGALFDSTWESPAERQSLTVGVLLMDVGHVLMALAMSFPRGRDLFGVHH